MALVAPRPQTVRDCVELVIRTLFTHDDELRPSDVGQLFELLLDKYLSESEHEECLQLLVEKLSTRALEHPYVER